MNISIKNSILTGGFKDQKVPFLKRNGKGHFTLKRVRIEQMGQHMLDITV